MCFPHRVCGRRRSDFWRKRQMTTLKAEKRSMDVKAKRLRREGYVTGNVFAPFLLRWKRKTWIVC
jgi:hypothetical protein